MCMRYQNADHTISLLDETHLIRDLENRLFRGSEILVVCWRQGTNNEQKMELRMAKNTTDVILLFSVLDMGEK
jgi:hypothetical protein